MSVTPLFLSRSAAYRDCTVKETQWMIGLSVRTANCLMNVEVYSRSDFDWLWAGKNLKYHFITCVPNLGKHSIDELQALLNLSPPASWSDIRAKRKAIPADFGITFDGAA